MESLGGAFQLQTVEAAVADLIQKDATALASDRRLESK
jgi:hypothetical protein